ncbi:hypothetical protein N9B17_05230 [Rhodopirellula sp.]|nr:hypothetical protein [Rhodopirellula sp.]
MTVTLVTVPTSPDGRNRRLCVWINEALLAKLRSSVTFTAAACLRSSRFEGRMTYRILETPSAGHGTRVM